MLGTRKGGQSNDSNCRARKQFPYHNPAAWLTISQAWRAVAKGRNDRGYSGAGAKLAFILIHISNAKWFFRSLRSI